METGIYVRVSTEEQAQEGYSIRAQEQKLKDFVRIKDWSVYKIYADEGISGKNITERPAMNELIADVQSGHVKNVLVFKIDRLTRSTTDLIYLVDLFNENECAFNSLMESIDTQTASGRMFLKIIGIFAEFERENIIERVKLGMERKVKEGYCLSPVSSFGYTRKIGEKIQEIEPEEAEIVRRVFDMYVNQGLSLMKIAKTLNTLAVPTKTKKSIWVPIKIRNILTNCNLIGNVRHYCQNGTAKDEWDGQHAPIISEELYEEAQQLLEKRKGISRTKQPSEENYFTGVLICKKCGHHLTTHVCSRTRKDGSIAYTHAYRCTNKLMNVCDASEMAHEKVEQAFQEYIDNIAQLEMPEEIQQQQEQKKQEQEQQVPIYQDKLKQLKAREREILNRYVDNEIEFDVYKTMTKRIESEMEIIQAELEQLTKPAPSETAITRADIIRELKENWLFLTITEKRQFLVKFVKGIVIQNEKEIGTRTRGKVRIFEVEFHGE